MPGGGKIETKNIYYFLYLLAETDPLQLTHATHSSLQLHTLGAVGCCVGMHNIIDTLSVDVGFKITY